MSSRSLRRAQKNKEIEVPVSSGDEDEIIEIKPRNTNLFQQFSLLNEESEEEADDQESSSSEEKEEIIIKPSKSQKKGKKGPADKKQQPEITEDDFDDFFASNSDSLNIFVSSSLKEQNDPFYEALSVDSAWLDANTELKKKFGGAVGGGSSVLGEINSRALRQNPALNRVVKRKPYKRKNVFITPRPMWPPFAPSETGLEVMLVKSQVGCDEYEIIEGAEYQTIFEELEILVRTGDLEFLIQLIHSQPLFVDGLLLLSDAYRMQSTGDAGEIVERALYILERILPADLSFLNGNVRFRYSHPGNRKFHLCLFRQIQFTMKKGCWRVALQLAKTLLALDPETDPLSARLFIDFLAIQSESFEDLDKLSIQLNNRCPLGPLPGWQLSRALRMFLDEENSKSDHSASTEALIEAFSSAPGASRLLLQSMKCKISDNFPNCEFLESDQAQIGVTKIFIARCITLWKSPSVQSWVESVIKSAIVKKAESLIDFRSVPLICQVPVYRHSLLSDLPSLNVAIPNQIASISSLNSHDPLPSESFDDEVGQRGSIISGLRNLLLGSFSRGS